MLTRHLLVCGLAVCLSVTPLLAETAGVPLPAINIVYPRLAKSAKIAGDVRLTKSFGAVTIVSGHPLLAQMILENAKELSAHFPQTDLNLTYHFILLDNTVDVPSSEIVKIHGPKRFVRRVLGLKTEKVRTIYECREGPDPPPNRIKLVGDNVDIWIFGKTLCLVTNYSTRIARR